jgi:acetyl-CoA carboxylase biotin carboxyl carrier protein
MDVAEIRKLIRVMRDHGILELEIQDRRGKVRLVREDGVRAAAPPPTPAAVPGVAVAGAVTVSAPLVGTFYRGPGPGSPAFVEQGALVEQGQVLCVIDGAAVEYGAPLFLIEPA